MNHGYKPTDSLRSLDQIADEFVARIRSGQHPSIQEYQAAFPELSDEIRELFPTLVALEKHDPVRVANDSSHTTPIDAPSQLGDYSIIREIGRGGMGIVYEAEHKTMRRRVALKVLPSNIKKPEYVQRFIREARAAGQLHHTNIVQVFDVGESAGVHYYAMQFIHGQNLDLVIEELQRLELESGTSDPNSLKTGGMQNLSIASRLFSGDSDATLPLPVPDTQDDGLTMRRTISTDAANPPAGPENPDSNRVTAPSRSVSGITQWSQIGKSGDSYYRRVARVGIQIADALQFAHNHGVLHRDIKPSNLILDTDGVVWVTDFGLAKDSSDDLTHTGDIVGTLRYMAPERFKGEADARSDVYSLGLTLYELCTLRCAFDKSDRAQLVWQVTSYDPTAPRRIRPGIPRDLETVIVKAIAREPNKRYSSARQMAADLQRFVSDRPVLARRVSVPEKIYRWARRHPTRAALVSCLILICALITGGSTYLASLHRKYATDLRKENALVLAEKNKTEVALMDAETANLSSRAHLYYAYLGQADAIQSSGKQGQNFDSLRSIRLAADLVPKLGLSPEKTNKRLVALRTSAIAAMALWDVDDVYRWKVADGWTNSVAVDFTNHRVAQADINGNIAIRKFGSQKVEFELPGVGLQAWLLMFSSDGKYLAARYHHPVRQANPYTCLWDVDEGVEKLRIDQVTLDAGGGHCFSKDGTLLAIPRNDNRIDVFSTESGEIKFSLKTNGPAVYLKFARSDTQLIVSDGDNNTINFWSLNPTREIVESIPVEANVTALDWMDTTNQMAAGIGNELLVWPPDDFNRAPLRLSGHEGRIVRIALHPSGKSLISTSWDGTSRLYDLVTGKDAVRMEGCRLIYSGFDDTGLQIGYSRHTDEFGIWQLPVDRPVKTLISGNDSFSRHKAKFLPGRSELIAYATPGGVEVWDHRNQRLVGSIPSGNTFDLCFNVDGSQIFTSGQNGLKQWDINLRQEDAGRYSVSFSDPTVILEGETRNTDFNDAKQLIAVRVGHNRVKVVDLESKMSSDIGPHVNVSRVLFTPDGRFLLTITWQGFGVKVWDMATMNSVTDIAPEISSVAIAYNRDTNRLCGTSGDALTEWSLENWLEISTRKREQPDGWPGDAVYSSDGKLLATTYSRYLPQLIDATSAQMIAILKAPSPCSVGGMHWSDDGRYLSVADQKTIHVWDIRQLSDRLRKLGIEWQR